MVFRRFAANLRRQDWTAVVLELVVVVVGVFIGLQASNWNADRQTDAKAAVFTERLRADLREEAWAYEYGSRCPTRRCWSPRIAPPSSSSTAVAAP